MPKYEINPKYKEFVNFLLNVRDHFKNTHESIHEARNELKIINENAQNLVVKSFKVPNILRRFFYTFLGDSKAKKSYDYSVKIGSFTPDPMGYVEFYEDNMLTDSYFVAQKFEYDFTIREPLLDNNFADKERILKEFAKFTFDLHENKILHKDYSPGNILIKKEANSFLFKIVDVNRMEFRELTLEDRLKNFDMLWAKDADLTIIAKEYAKVAKFDEDASVAKALKFSRKLKDFKNMKKRLKGIPVVD